jgi:hypothetical protein
LAEAGFHFTPTEPGDDTATCYACDKSLGGWEAGDDPLSEHFTHSSACPWATLMMQQRKKTLLPQGPEMQAAREASFVGWPYEKKRGWTIKARKVSFPTTFMEDLLMIDGTSRLALCAVCRKSGCCCVYLLLDRA